MATIDLKGNTNFVFLKNLNHDLIVPRTNLAAVDLTTANGLDVTGNTIYAKLATIADVSAGTSGALVNAAVVKSYVSSYTHTSAVIPQSAVSGLATKFTNTSNYVSTYTHSANVIPTSAISGLATEITNGASAYVNSTGVIPNSALSSYDSIITLTGNTVTVAPGNGYRLDATTGSKTIAIDAFDTGLWGRESHIELFVTSSGYVHTGTNVTLIDPLEPDAVNNCTVRFHDGHAVISVEDHAEAYLVNTTGTGSATSGTLAYGLKQVPSAGEMPIYNYIGFRSELNTSSVPTGGATATVVKHIVGNGVDIGPTITGNLIVKGGATVRDVKLSGVTVTSGNVKLTDVYCAGNITAGTGCTMTLGDVFIPSGLTVTVSGGGLAIEKVSGDGGVIDLGRTKLPIISSGSSALISGCTIFNGLTGGDGILQVISGGLMIFSSSVVTQNEGQTAYNGHAVAVYGSASFTDCIVSGNSGSRDMRVRYGGNLTLLGCTIGNLRCESGNINIESGSATKINAAYAVDGAGCTVTISSGATLDLTGDTTATPINPGAGVIVSGACTVINSAGTSVSIVGGTYTQIKNDGTTVPAQP